VGVDECLKEGGPKPQTFLETKPNARRGVHKKVGEEKKTTSWRVLERRKRRRRE